MQLSLKTKKKFLHGDVELAKKLLADGVHLRSDQLMQIYKAKSYGLYTIISTHSIDEAKLAQKLGADAITFSPIFHSPDKGEAKGVEALEQLLNVATIPVFALGGIIGIEQINSLKPLKNLYGFASIRYFVDPQIDKVR